MTEDKLRIWAKDVFDIACLVGVLYCGRTMWTYRFANPSLTETQLFLDLFYHYIFCIIAGSYLSPRLR